MKELEDIIRAEIAAKGPVTFERFVELALYHPAHGYYASGRARIGKEGDYYTSASATPVYGMLVSEAYVELARRMGGPVPFVEMGAGEGHFASDFLSHLKAYHPAEYKGMSYVIVERSDGMAERQKGRLKGYRRKVAWLAGLEDMGPIEGVFFSNELVDAFPFHRVRQTADRLEEVYVGLRGGELEETSGSISTPELARYMNRLRLQLADGVRSEINLRALDWMRLVASRLARGYVITVDYGYTGKEYYAPTRRAGTMLCYNGHRTNEEPLRDIGEQDITAHADFSSLAMVGKLEGLVPALYSDQASFLLRYAAMLDKTLKAAGAPQEEMERIGRGLTTLLHPSFMGGAFKVLVQTKGVEGGGFDGIRDRAGSLF